ncbi:MAG: di-trans,poly-cis-decaprenylcistransferase [Bacteroidales bacterium]|jgi:undecaprenyl diphosphate synthase|nr:di-trans,poly-cis-decaprenylcistransferase [Bacteroidales bacterium]MBP5635692.1 di-trans,poly-cis-decaprenylcistransferase [Bacteroidales bacterium]MBR0110705.1 di-trans,poly-cis-decaprenylcistransferase [Bacteroidales bacterium]MBR6280664.1 di-trans,poly-cis-decaprenylcistransferase [Bacteroidales bacterium]
MEEEKKLPVHVSIIMDGNGRWAKERGQERIHGHFEGVASVRACAEEAARQGIRYLSLFAFSEENWNRPGAEVGALMELMGKSVCDEEKTLMDNNMRFLVLGNRARLSAGLEAAIRALEEKTAANTGTTLVVFLSYSGKWDLLQAARRMAAAGDDDLEKYLVTAGVPDPDLIIRTSGEQRLSNFLLWQAAYAELLFVDKYWPDFREADFRAALEEFAKRDRRYGKVK